MEKEKESPIGERMQSNNKRLKKMRLVESDDDYSPNQKKVRLI